jgi:hypothetical protein
LHIVDPDPVAAPCQSRIRPPPQGMAGGLRGELAEKRKALSSRPIAARPAPIARWSDRRCTKRVPWYRRDPDLRPFSGNPDGRTRMKWIVAIVACTASLACAVPGEVSAKGCLRGAVAGGVVGHYAGHHAVAGAIGGCIAAHEYYKHKAEKAKQQQQQQHH